LRLTGRHYDGQAWEAAVERNAFLQVYHDGLESRMPFQSIEANSQYGGLLRACLWCRNRQKNLGVARFRTYVLFCDRFLDSVPESGCGSALHQKGLPANTYARPGHQAQRNDQNALSPAATIERRQDPKVRETLNGPSTVGQSAVTFGAEG
jgi:hypothetical protein